MYYDVDKLCVSLFPHSLSLSLTHTIALFPPVAPTLSLSLSLALVQLQCSFFVVFVVVVLFSFLTKDMY